MKKSLVFIIIFIPALIFGQQLPLTESYLIDPFAISSAYTGIHSPGMLTANFRSDWTGITGGPRTFRLGYHQQLPLIENVSVGAKIMSDQTDIFRQNYLLTSYAYKIAVGKDQVVNFGISFGLYRNSINLERYYNSSDYQIDPVFVNNMEKSRLKFMTDFGALYCWNQLEAGLIFSNVTFGNSYYKDAPEISNKPLSNFIVHATYHLRINDIWGLKPFILFRDGKNSPSQLEMAVQAFYRNKYWISGLYRGKGIWSAGIGGEIINGIILAYSYNAGYHIELSAFQNHEITLGIHLNKMTQALSGQKQ